MRMCSGLASGSASMPMRPEQAGGEALDLVTQSLDVVDRVRAP